MDQKLIQQLMMNFSNGMVKAILNVDLLNYQFKIQVEDKNGLHMLNPNYDRDE
jgi:hypothetical protein